MRTILFGTLFLIALIIFVLTATPAGQTALRFLQALKGESPSSSFVPSGKTTLSANPFGLEVGAKNLDFVAKAEVASGLGVSYYKPAPILMQSWRGFCVECEDALSKSLKLVVVVQASGRRGETSGPPASYENFKKGISELIDKYRPALVVVEENETEAGGYSGSTSDYLTELRITCSVVHEKETKCANGGIEGEVLLEMSKPSVNTEVSDEVRAGKSLVSQYRSSGADYVNFHWNINDPELLSTSVDFLQNEANLRAISTEIGINSDKADEVMAVLQKIVDLHLPIAIWDSVDVTGISRGLTDDGGKIRPTGEAFKDFLQARY